MVDQIPTVDQVEPEGGGSTSPLEQNIKSRTTWLRLLFILIYCALISLAGFVGTFVVVVGFFWVLFTGEVNQQLRLTPTTTMILNVPKLFLGEMIRSWILVPDPFHSQNEILPSLTSFQIMLEVGPNFR